MEKNGKNNRSKIISSLYSYIKNKHMLENTQTYLQLYNEMHILLQNYMQIRREMLATIALVNSIDNTLSELPPELSQYAQLRYFQPNHYTLDGLAMQLNVTRRTVQRWDDLLIATIDRHLKSDDEVIFD